MLEVQNISRTYRVQKQDKTVLRAVNLSFPDAGFVCICGKTGSGKTTLLNLLGLQATPSTGEILYNGRDICTYTENEKNHYRRNVIGRVSQDYDLIPEMTVWDNCALAPSMDSPLPSEYAAVIRHHWQRWCFPTWNGKR